MNQFWSKATIFCGGWILVASAVDPMKLLFVKGNYFSVGDGFRCLCQGPNEINFGQRQPFFCGRWILVASAVDPMKSRLAKGNYVTLEAGN